MASPVQDWGKIDESNKARLRSEIPRVAGSSKEYARLHSTLDTMLEMKGVATQHQLHVAGLARVLQTYLE
jgi:hypothetical protein